MREAETKKFAKVIADAVWHQAVVLLIVFIVSTAFFNAVRDHFRIGWDATDGHSERSGMEIRTDCATGVQYLQGNDGLTPRLDANGKIMVRACE